MAKIYATLIIKGTKHIDEVPEVIREDVKAILVELGYPELAGYEIEQLPLPVDPEVPEEPQPQPKPDPEPEVPVEEPEKETYPLVEV